MKIDKIEFSRDITIKPIADRWYRIDGAFTVDIYLKDEGVVHISVDDGFMFDGRSGPKLIDYFAPNLGTQGELKTYLLHDLLSYDIYFSFNENNDIFYKNLRDKNYCNYGYMKAKIIKGFVSISDSYFGIPLPDSREYPNLNKIHVRHYDKLYKGM